MEIYALSVALRASLGMNSVSRPLPSLPLYIRLHHSQTNPPRKSLSLGWFKLLTALREPDLPVPGAASAQQHHAIDSAV